MRELTFDAYGRPAPQGSKRHIGRGVMIESSRHVKPWRTCVQAAAMEAINGTHGVYPLTGSLAVSMVFTVARPKGHYRTGRNAHLVRDSTPTRPGTMPDLSKLIRATEDALTDAGVWRDDALVVEYFRAAKVYANEDIDALFAPGVRIMIRQVELVPRIRTIKPEFFTSLTVADLPLRARLTFVGLWTHVDDAGRCIDDARLIKAAVWPLDDVTAADVDEDLRALTESSLITRYRLGERSYLTVSGWDEHQRISRPTASKLPGPFDQGVSVLVDPSTWRYEDSLKAHGGLSEDSSPERKGKERNREQGKEQGSAASQATLDGFEDNTPSSKRFEVGSDDDPDFVCFWEMYPRKSAKEGARKSWRAAVKKVKPADIIAGAKRYRDDPKRKADYTAHPTTWLNQGRWADELVASRAGAAAPVAKDFSDWGADS